MSVFEASFFEVEDFATALVAGAEAGGVAGVALGAVTAVASGVGAGAAGRERFAMRRPTMPTRAVVPQTAAMSSGNFFVFSCMTRF
jgi:hypothetical protein